MFLVIVIVVLIAVVTVLNLKTSRPDGTYLGQLHPYRKLMLYIMPTRNESVVYYDTYAKADALHAYIEEARKRFHCDVTHCIVAGVAYGIHLNPTMNRFAVGHRLYDRNGVWVTFSMKRQKKGRKAKLAAVKLEVPADITFMELAQKMQGNIKVERSDTETYLDKELGILSAIPRPLLRFGVKVLKMLDYYGLLPAGFIKNDAMYTSIFAANLGSLGMKAGFHHLYEWGTCPLFVMIGAVEERALVEDGQVVVRSVIPLRFTYDERVDDGLNAGIGIGMVVEALENPAVFFGCLAADGSQDRPLGQALKAAEPVELDKSVEPPAEAQASLQ